MLSQKLFFRVLCDSGKPQTLEIKPKRCTVVQNRRSLFLFKNHTLFKIAQKMTPPGTPKDSQKIEKTLKNVTWKTTLKKTLEKSEKEPVLAMEREAR